jgi:hypothetical protein
MKKTILEIYALAVCFITLMCFVVCLGIASYSLVEITNPSFTMSTSQYQRHQNNDAYWKNCCDLQPYSNTEKIPAVRPSEAELTKQRLESYQFEQNSERREGFQTLVKTLIIMLVDVLTFLVHWFIAKRSRLNVSI